MTAPVRETLRVQKARVSCDGGGGALGHPRVWLMIPREAGFVICPYCDRRFELEADEPGPGDEAEEGESGCPGKE